MRTLMAWIGYADLAASRSDEGIGGPIGGALVVGDYEQVILLANYKNEDVKAYSDWLVRNGAPQPNIKKATLSSPTNFREIYQVAKRVLDDFAAEYGSTDQLTIHLSPGTPAMAAVWIILARTRTTARLIQSSPEEGVKEADIPFDIAAEFIPDLFSAHDKRRLEESGEKPPEAASFYDINYRSKEMERRVRDAKKAALRNLPVLIEGETGTGKELFARAIHNSSQRRSETFHVVNCGAIPAELVESEFFGHTKGAFTGALKDRKGAFEAANGGTLFLDEIGELPLAAQVKLLRALHEGEITPVGGDKSRKVDVRIIAATNRNLMAEVVEGNFREDLYYRLAIATLDLPPLREREGDVWLLAERLLEQVNRSAREEPGYKQKTFSASAKKLVLKHSWPGNVRELLNTVKRATLFADGEEISSEDMARAIRAVPNRDGPPDGVLNHEIYEGFAIEDRIDQVKRHYLERALEKTGGNKAQAAKLLGLKSAQTLTYWLEKLGIA
ncbi:sigma 54-interacting transcriptional regulator [Croceicoccus sp. 1NDH52]|nr:sigma 54-interacting transcriptional regulator [Croceicoccus gelatinilyticus]